VRYLHTMIRVEDLDRSVDFYTNVLGLDVLRRMDVEEGRFTLVFLGIGTDPMDAFLELTYNWDGRGYDLGTGYGHVALGVNDVAETVEQIRSRGGTVSREPRQLEGGGPVLAFVEDPDGYQIELVESGD